MLFSLYYVVFDVACKKSKFARIVSKCKSKKCKEDKNAIQNYTVNLQLPLAVLFVSNSAPNQTLRVLSLVLEHIVKRLRLDGIKLFDDFGNILFS